ncbi:autotransporter domain-containing protein [Luteibacter sp. NPDC031894]|uniref:autotransporter domain-containing protein n=1 Tax=Luteibacter sp. NPDC031894 TaxID=3390572 RepID=UPI003D066AFC
MNRIFRLVWNGALRVVQVASELSSSRSGMAVGAAPTVPRRRTLWTAMAALGLCAAASPAFAQVCTPSDSTACSAQGGVSFSDRTGRGGAGNGQGGWSVILNDTTFTPSPGGLPASGVGGAGADGFRDGFPEGAGGAGGVAGVETAGAITAGRGGDGGQSIAAAGGGGGGGTGLYTAAAGVSINANVVVTGGQGGTGGAATTDSGAGGGGGGGGGAGFIATAGNFTLTLDAGTKVFGGAGGAGGSGDTDFQAFGGGGGGGGDGVLLFGSNTLVTNTGGTITGGAGGAGGVAQTPGIAGEAGAGIRALAGGLRVTNTGTISGGAGTGDGLAGIGIITQGAGSIQNAGTIEGGSGSGGARASAILFNGANNVLSLLTGSVITGAVEVADASNAHVIAVNDASVGTVQLDGSTATVDLSPGAATAQNLTIGNITGTGTVTSTSGGGNLSLQGVNIDGSLNLSHPGSTTLAGTLHTTGSQRYGTPVALAADTTVISDSGTTTFAGTIDGAHDLNVLANGTLLFSDVLGGATQLQAFTASAPAMAIGAVNAASMDLTIGSSISQTGAFNVSGNSRFQSNGDITLSNAGNAFGGSVTLSGQNVDVMASADLNVASVVGNGNVTLHSEGLLTLPTIVSSPAVLDLYSGFGSVTAHELSASTINLHTGGALTLTGDVTALSSFNLEAASAIQAAGAITASAFSGTIGGNLSLTSAANNIIAIGDLQVGGDASLTSSIPMGITGVLHAGSLTLNGPNTTLTGTIQTDLYTNLAGGSILSVGNGGTTGTLDSDIAANGTLVFNRSDDVAFDGALGGSGQLVKLGAGRLLFDGAGAPFLGSTQVQAGGLVVGTTAGSAADLAGDVTVSSGASLGGHGTIGGDVLMNTGSTLSPGNSVGTLTVGGDLTMSQGTTFDAEFGAAGAGDKVIVGGNLLLNDVTLNVSDAGGMGPGVYNLFDYDGTLSLVNGGMTLGTTPNGHLLTLQYLIGDKRINLVDYSNVTLQYWNANGLASPAQMGGGDGTWSRTSATWTDGQGSVTAPMNPQPGFAIFGGAPGTVTIDNTGGAVSATGMQFLSDGYRITGGPLDLVASGGPVIVRVGDGSQAGRDYVATIDSVLTGVQGLTKTDAGTLVLNGANTFAGGVAIHGGTLSVSDDRNLGDAANDVNLGGGELRITGTGYTSTDRPLTLQTGGGIDIDDASNVFTWNGPIRGPGTWEKTGAGTLVLNHANNYGGLTWLADGTLRLGDSGAIAAGDLVLSGGTLELAKDGLSFANAVRLAGAATVDVDAGDTATLAGSISDSALPGTTGAPVAGSLTKTGAGTLVLLGTAANTGATTVAEGVLHVGDGGTRGTLSNTIADNATLVLDRSDAVDYAGILSGTGTFHKLGGNDLHLTGDSSAFAGTTTIDGGTLQLDGSLGGSLAMASGSVLSGTGKAGSASLASGSELSPGGSGAIGTLSFGGDLQMASGVRYTVDVSDAGQGDSVAVDGKAMLHGGSVVSLGTGGHWNTLTTYTILSARGGVDGTFADVSSDLAFLTPSLAYAATAVNLTLTRNNVDFAEVAATRNQRATAGALQSLGLGAPLYDAFLQLDAAGARRGFDALSGEIHANLRGALTDDDRYQRDAINQHLLTQYADGTGEATTAWASTWGHWGNHDGDGNAARLSANGSGVLVGADTGVGSDTRLGFALGTGHVSASARADSASGDTRTAGLYGSGHYGNVLLQAGALYSHRDIDTHRSLDEGDFQDRLNGNLRARSAQVFVEGAYEFRFDRASLAPYLNLARQELRTGGLHERGGDAALDVMGDKSAQTFGTVGLRGRWDLSAEGGIGLFGSVGWQHAWGDTETLSRQRFASGGDAFQVAGTPIAENAGVATFGLRFKPAASVTIDASYSGQFANDAKDQSARLSLNWAF